ncbi:hypothetical protein A2U01_0052913, partial [Trifolium medium]|nr:hypothetical protein [Trifolium medium]
MDLITWLLCPFRIPMTTAVGVRIGFYATVQSVLLVQLFGLLLICKQLRLAFSTEIAISETQFQ